MRKVLLYRDFEESILQAELHAAQKAGFTLVNDRSRIQPGDMIVPRFYPFYNYLADEFTQMGAHLIANNHEWVSDLRQWAPVLGDMTPQTWFSLDEVYTSGFPGPFFVKGIDKSLKTDFNRFCYAADVERLPIVLDNLRDALPVEQPLVIREFAPLTTYGVSEKTGMPIAHEFRVFVYKGQVLSDGFYWETVRKRDALNLVDAPDYTSFVQRVVDKVGDWCEFYALDIALTATGEWIVIELNDGCLSGLSANNPEVLYKNLFDAI